MATIKRHFLRTQFVYLFRTYPQRRSWRHKLWILVEALMLLIRYWRLQIDLLFAPKSITTLEKNCVVILLSHNRPQNLSLIVRGTLRTGFVGKVVVSNSNPKVHIADWIDERDPRLLLIDEDRSTQPGHRLVLARQHGTKHILAIDDDIFLSPTQWKRLFGYLVSDETVPHGITGNIYRPGTRSSNGSPFHHITGVERDVDVLIGAYAFTCEHLERVFALAAAIGIGDVSLVRNYDDILLSFGGGGRPRIHAIKPALLCASASLSGVALWKSDEQFWDERERVFQQVRGARLALDSPWSERPEQNSGKVDTL
jgi:hypothetical protein